MEITQIIKKNILEHRRGRRASLSLPVDYKIKKTIFWKGTQSIDVSRSGGRIAVSKGVEVGARLDLKIKLLDKKNKCCVRGRVVWVNPSPNNNGTVDCGVAFEKSRDSMERTNAFFIWNKFCDSNLKNMRHHKVRAVQSFEELKEVFRLLYQEYARNEYCEPHPSKMHYTYHVLLTHAQTFVLKQGGQLLGTISIIKDSPIGLPMDVLYAKEMAKLRARGRSLVEPTLLALNSNILQKNCHLKMQKNLFQLFKIMVNYARFVTNATDLVITIHPKHKFLYKYFNMEVLGPMRAYPEVCRNPAIPMRLNMQKAIDNAFLNKAPERFFFRAAPPVDVLKKKLHLTSQELRELLYEQKPLWHGLCPKKKDYINQCYPQFVNC